MRRRHDDGTTNFTTLRRSVTLVAVLAVVATGCANDKPSAGASSTGTVDGVGSKEEFATFRAIGSVGQASLVDVTPNTPVELLDRKGKVVARGRGDRLGTAMFYDVPPGDGYIIRGDVGHGIESTPPFAYCPVTTFPTPSSTRASRSSRASTTSACATGSSSP